MPAADMVQVSLEVEGVSYLLSPGGLSGFIKLLSVGKLG